MQMSYYEVLGVADNASESEIKLAYKEKLLTNHPDKGVTQQTLITLIKQAYTTLVNPVERQKYDESFKESIKRLGFNVSGDGLDTYGLEEFEEDEAGWNRECPRCQIREGITLTEEDLENGSPDGSGGYDIIVQCSSCSLWIKVKYYEAE
ncbi:diphthamide biosynthesis protein 4 [Suhomyces tanzawaensis NRRL Y-17324]|uniref:Diphthamide biosynthesis protein 4 n=1 Tax=Suhomyces tanzawaensis NRRL Y-17324 TaxID=984487 RepID=A0A1E4SLT3_9ASCO|nr:diphthamide biosynthesis protein 4 [Suhomyces tanzawaensis NRRL Y-17324]ODV80455.1 diphthamide biosynthesis protein 4 [Suhomyces tanzawaensis NRRL Y-17324]